MIVNLTVALFRMEDLDQHQLTMIDNVGPPMFTYIKVNIPHGDGDLTRIDLNVGFILIVLELLRILKTVIINVKLDTRHGSMLVTIGNLFGLLIVCVVMIYLAKIKVESTLNAIDRTL